MNLRALKIRIYPNESQRKTLDKTFGCTRFIYNKMLSEHIEVYERLKDKRRELYEYKYTTEKQLKEEFEFLSEVDSISLQQARINLGAAYQNFFRRMKDPTIPSDQKGFPKFKKKFAKNSYRTVLVNGNLKIDFTSKKLKAPKLGWISFRDPRVIEDIRIQSVTFSRTKAFKYYASVLYVDETEPIQQVDVSKPNLKVKGLDMSLTSFFVDDEGNSPQYDQLYRKAEKKLAELQRRIDKTGKKSLKDKLWLRYNRLQEHIANKRRDFIEKLSAKLVEENDVIALETLSLRDMAKFKKWEERRELKDKSNHGKSVNDLGWGHFVSRLKTKAAEKGKIVVQADKWFASTQTCNVCGYRNRELEISDREWKCPTCGTLHKRDQNAAVNLRDIALNMFTEGTSGSATEKWNGNHLQ